MWVPKLVALAAIAHGQQCVIEAGGSKFDFSSLSARQLSFQERGYIYTFTFCKASPQPCGSLPTTSLCQTLNTFEYSLGLWSEFKDWNAGSGGQKLTGSLTGEVCEGTKDRLTNVTFQCGDGAASIVSMTETALCEYEMVINVPRAVCTPTASCCAPPTYTSTRVEIGGARQVVQRDASTGDWFDGNYQARGQRLLCSTYYNRCFTYPPTLVSCVGSAYRAAPVQCFGSPDWNFVTQSPLSDSTPITQSVWASALDGNYVVTMPLGASPSCVPVSGSAIDTSVGFSLTPDSSLWEVPQICLKQLDSTNKF